MRDLVVRSQVHRLVPRRVRASPINILGQQYPVFSISIGVVPSPILIPIICHVAGNSLGIVPDQRSAKSGIIVVEVLTIVHFVVIVVTVVACWWRGRVFDSIRNRER